MEIREIKPSDSESFVEFYNKLASETDYLVISPEEISEKAEKAMEMIEKDNEYKKVFIALEDDKIVGFIGIKRCHFAKLRHIAKLMIGVLDDYKKQGIGTKLLSYAENWAKERNVKRLEITVIEENDAGIEFFEEMDFEKEGTRENAVKIKGEYFDELFMAKELEED